MSIFIRDELNTSGITPGNSESPNVNPHYVGRTQRDTLDTSGDTTPGQADNNPDFITLDSLNDRPVQNQLPINLHNGWNTIAYPGIISMPILDFLNILYINDVDRSFTEDSVPSTKNSEILV